MVVYTVIDVEIEWKYGECYPTVEEAYSNRKNTADCVEAIENGVWRDLNAEEQAIFDHCRRNTHWWKR